MGLFEGDTYVILKPREEWTTARQRRLVAAFDTALAVIPGLEIAFTQPLAMRLDEAESGIRTDLGVKVVGADLEPTSRGERIRGIVAAVPGAADVSVEIAMAAGQYRITSTARRWRATASRSPTCRRRSTSAPARVAAELVDGRGASAWPCGSREARGDLEALARITLRTGGRASRWGRSPTSPR
jgi:heavy metal efflux system protein